MSRAIENIISGIGIGLLFLMMTGCGSRHGESFRSNDGTTIFNLNSNPGFRPEISFCWDFDENTGTPVWPDSVFTIDDKEWLNAIIRLNNLQNAPEVAVFHVDWVAPDGNSMFIKEIDVDSAGYIQSSISISPERRKPGKYTLKLYYFRELIAIKTFVLLPENSVNYSLASRILPHLSFCSETTKTGECIDADSVFTIRKKGWVKAVVKIRGVSALTKGRTRYQLEWHGWDGQVFYTKNIDVEPEDPMQLIFSSISIPPGKREPGQYGLKVYCFDELVCRGSFTLVQSE